VSVFFIILFILIWCFLIFLKQRAGNHWADLSLRLMPTQVFYAFQPPSPPLRVEAGNPLRMYWILLSFLLPCCFSPPQPRTNWIERGGWVVFIRKALTAIPCHLRDGSLLRLIVSSFAPLRPYSTFLFLLTGCCRGGNRIHEWPAMRLPKPKVSNLRTTRQYI